MDVPAVLSMLLAAGVSPSVVQLAHAHLGEYVALLQHMAAELGVRPWNKVEERHLARMPVDTLDGADKFVRALMEIERGLPESALGANDAVAGLRTLLDGLDARNLRMPCMDLREAALARLGGSRGGGIGGAQDVSDVLLRQLCGGGAGSKTVGAARAKDLDAPVVSMLLDAVVANGTVPAFELIFLRPGNRAVSEGCYWGCTFDQARDRIPSYPSNAEMPFQSCVSASRAAFIEGKKPTNEAVRDGFLAQAAALEAAAQRAPLPLGFRDAVIGAGAPVGLSGGGGYKAMRLALLGSSAMRSVEGSVLLERLIRLQDLMAEWSQASHWSVVYVKAVSYLETVSWVAGPVKEEVAAVKAVSFSEPTVKSPVVDKATAATAASKEGRSPSGEAAEAKMVRQIAHLTRQNEDLAAKARRLSDQRDGRGGRGGTTTPETGRRDRRRDEDYWRDDRQDGRRGGGDDGRR